MLNPLNVIRTERDNNYPLFDENGKQVTALPLNLDSAYLNAERPDERSIIFTGYNSRDELMEKIKNYCEEEEKREIIDLMNLKVDDSLLVKDSKLD